jgi:hypothetical protein
VAKLLIRHLLPHFANALGGASFVHSLDFSDDRNSFYLSLF